jgi:hypothetical protein
VKKAAEVSAGTFDEVVGTALWKQTAAAWASESSPYSFEDDIK